ncbi:DUF4166 domain-containing protein [Caryophanon latum]|uniref:DUF4166 domain-containing protein n=1 Tax=Caryophanon latum TaxID=33977 RepID=A0A1C0YJE1_9BACL|nr:DUF4166 domain-containing protein [Caryophanon latum]OCS87254.1 hypothetical protein A6K76_02475 [Caryophanon latum]
MIYKQLLEEQFQQLHPKLQERYELPIDTEFFARGTMERMTTNERLRPMYMLLTTSKFLFPESGVNIPFTIANRSYKNERNDDTVYWERTFYFPHVTRQFNATMTLDATRNVIQDNLGDPSLFYSDLQLHVTNGGMLLIRSTNQRCLGLPLPKALTGRVTVLEGYDDARDVYTIDVTIYNDLFGRMMTYAGTFTRSTR